VFADADAETLRMVLGWAVSIVSALAVGIVVIWRQQVADARRREEALSKQVEELLRVCLANGLRSQIPDQIAQAHKSKLHDVDW